MRRNRVNVRSLTALTVALLLVSGCLLADWDTAAGRGLFPYWQTGSNWFTLLTFVNTSEETSDVIYICLIDIHGESGIPPAIPVFPIRQREMLIFSTVPSVPIWIPVTAGYGYVAFRVQGGGFIQALCFICNLVTGSGYIVPAYHQDSGF